jgi:hypothetical protein
MKAKCREGSAKSIPGLVTSPKKVAPHTQIQNAGSSSKAAENQKIPGSTQPGPRK